MWKNFINAENFILREGFIMAVKLFVSDLDGTLLNRQHKISEKNKQAVQRAVAAGVTVTIATGRMYPSALPYAKQLNVDVPIITYNGAMIKTVSGEILAAEYIEEEAVKDIVAFCRGQNWYIQVYAGDTLYFAEHDENAKAYETAAGVVGVAVGDKLGDVCRHVPKMLVVVEDVEKTDEFVLRLQEKFSGRVFVTKSNPEYIEIVSPKVNKAAALTILMEKLHLEKEEVMAIGDSNNDAPMLKYAGKSVAMGNASEGIKRLCAYVTGDCDEDGVAEAIEKYVLQER